MQSLLQTKLWAEFKSRHGWKCHDLEDISILERPLPMNKTMLYAPEVSIDSATPDRLKQLTTNARKLSPNAIFFRLEIFTPLAETDSSLVAALTNAGFKKSFEEVQPEHRQWVPIEGAESTIISQMKEKGRYNVRLSQRKGVTTRVSTDTKDIEVFYLLFQETAVRDGFTIRELGYFHDLADTLFSNKKGALIIADYEGQPLAAILLTFHDGLASYLYGASSNAQRNLMAPYAAHWAAIQEAKKHDCKIYDLIQIAPPNSDDKHHYTNLTRFKQQFGGERVDLVGGWDYVYQPLWYTAFTIAEKFRRH